MLIQDDWADEHSQNMYTRGQEFRRNYEEASLQHDELGIYLKRQGRKTETHPEMLRLEFFMKFNLQFMKFCDAEVRYRGEFKLMNSTNVYLSLGITTSFCKDP